MKKPASAVSIEHSINRDEDDLKEALIAQSENEKRTKFKFSMSQLRESLAGSRRFVSDKLDWLALKAKQAPVHPLFKCSNLATRHAQKLQITHEDRNAYLIRTRREKAFYDTTLKWNEYSVRDLSDAERDELKDEDKVVATTINFLKSSVDTFEKIEVCIDKGTGVMWLLILSLCCLTSLLVHAVESRAYLDSIEFVDSLFNATIVIACASAALLVTALFLPKFFVNPNQPCCKVNNACVVALGVMSMVVIAMCAVCLLLVYQVFIFIYCAVEVDADLMQSMYHEHRVLLVALYLNTSCVCMYMAYMAVWLLSNGVVLVLLIYGCIVASACLVRYYYVYWCALTFAGWYFVRDCELDQDDYDPLPDSGVVHFLMAWAVLRMAMVAAYVACVWLPFYVYKLCGEHGELDERFPRRWRNVVGLAQVACIAFSVADVVVHWTVVVTDWATNDCVSSGVLVTSVFSHIDVAAAVVIALDSKIGTGMSLRSWLDFFLKIGVKKDWKQFMYPVMMSWYFWYQSSQTATY